ncbi:MAG: hypothetical protein JW850_18920 [Thermoflexales bacterium]|nr:hypothetical protein [Thermoflexales bacterium]
MSARYALSLSPPQAAASGYKSARGAAEAMGLAVEVRAVGGCLVGEVWLAADESGVGGGE